MFQMDLLEGTGCFARGVANNDDAVHGRLQIETVHCTS